jgi:hypothetical protein
MSSNASIATNGELTFSSTFGGGSAQLTRIDESTLAGQLNLRCRARLLVVALSSELRWISLELLLT